MKNPIKLVVATGAAGVLVLGLSATSAFGLNFHHHTEATSHVSQHSDVDTDQHAHSNTGDNLVVGTAGQANLTLFSFSNHNHAFGVALLSTGDADASNTASTTVSQTNTSSVTADGSWWSHPEATDHVHQSSDVDTDQHATANTGDNVVVGAGPQLNANIASGHDTNNAVGIAAASTGDASSSNSSTTSVTQSNSSTVSSSN